MSPKAAPPPRQSEQEKRAADRRERVRLEQQRKTRPRRVLVAGVAVAVIALTIVLVVVLTGSPSTPSATFSIATHPFTPGTQAIMSISKPPWPLPTNAANNIAAAGLQVLGAETLTVHYHAHLDVIVNGKPVTVPAEVGFDIVNGTPIGLSSLHTHDTSGIMHIESSTKVPFELGQFFTEWGVRLSPSELGGLADGGGKVLRTYVDGHLFGGDPSTILLQRHEEIALWYGPASQKPNVPSSYQFPAGL